MVSARVLSIMAFVAVLLLYLATVTAVQSSGDHDLIERLSRMEALLLAQDNRLHKLENDNQALLTSNQALLTSNKQLLHGVSQLRTEDEKVKIDNEQMKTEVKELKLVKTENQQLRDSVAVLSNKVNALEAVFSDLIKKHQGEAKTEDETPPRDMAARSDDINSLELVVAQMGQQLTTVIAEVQAMKIKAQNAAVSVNTRWGHSSCPDSNQLVFSGVIGGSYYAHTGAATNYLCLTMSHINHALPGNYAYLYGGEYQTDDENNQKDPVCAVCRSPRPSTITIPGTDVCTSGWTLEYSGYLMAGGYGHTAGSEYICVDSALLSRPAGDANEEGKLLYFTVTQCGSLPCGPYVNNTIVTCAVCSQ